MKVNLENKPVQVVSQSFSSEPVDGPLHTEDSVGNSGSMGKNETGGGGGDASDDGDRFLRLLEVNGLNKSRLAKKVGLSPSAIQKWEVALSRGTVSDDMWQSIAEALSKVGINPSELRPGYQPKSRGRVADLVQPILSVEGVETLRLMRELLLVESSYDREILLKLVETKLASS